MDVRRVVVLRPKWIRNRDETLKRVLHRVLRRVGQNVVPLPHLPPGGGGGTSRALRLTWRPIRFRRRLSNSIGKSEEN